MSRSRRKTPIIPAAPISDKPGKQIRNRGMRRIVREVLKKDPEGEMPHRRAILDAWEMPKDGRVWYGWDYPEMMRK